MNTLYVFEKQKLCNTQYLRKLVKKALCCEAYQLCDTYKSDWVRAEKKSEICKNISIIVEGKLPTRIISIECYNDKTEIYMDNGWQVALKSNPSINEQISNIALIGAPIV